MADLGSAAVTELFRGALKRLDASFPCGIAISGGGDSMALCRLLVDEVGADNIVGMHFNHGLREEADEEQLWLTKELRNLGVALATAKWQEHPQKGNTQQAARWARYAFYQETCMAHNLSGVFVGHTQDDIAEGLLMRLGRGSGLKGLAAMEEKSLIAGVTVYRPMLDINRESLRGYLLNLGQDWLEDPSNYNPHYMRARVRKLKSALESAGISFEAIAASAFSLQRAKSALLDAVDEFYDTHVCAIAEDVYKMDHSLLDQPEEVALQMIEKIILNVNPEPLAPRTTKRALLLDKMREGQLPSTLGGVQITSTADGFLFMPEKQGKMPLASEAAES